jgi:hypothetical protein
VVAEQGIIRFLQYVPLEEVSTTPLACPRLFLLRGPLRRVTNTFLRCRHGMQLVSGPTMTLYLRVADFVSTARGGGEQWRCKDVFIAKVNLNQIRRLTVTVAGVGLARRTPQSASPHSAKGPATSCKSPFLDPRRSDPWLIALSRAFPQSYSGFPVLYISRKWQLTVVLRRSANR